MNRRALLRNLVLILLVEAGLLSLVYAALHVGRRVSASVNAVLPASSVPGPMMVPCTLNFLRTRCEIDTGSGAAMVLSPSLARATGVIAGPSQFVLTPAGGANGATATLTVGLAGSSASVQALVLPNWSGPPLVGVPLLASLHAIVVLDAPQGQAWVWVPSR